MESVLEEIKNRQEPAVASIIRTKLTGKAVEALSQNSDFRMWEDIKTILKNRFGDFREEVQLVQELMQLTKDKTGIDLFADKVREIAYAMSYDSDYYLV